MYYTHVYCFDFEVLPDDSRCCTSCSKGHPFGGVFVQHKCLIFETVRQFSFLQTSSRLLISQQTTWKAKASYSSRSNQHLTFQFKNIRIKLRSNFFICYTRKKCIDPSATTRPLNALELIAIIFITKTLPNIHGRRTPWLCCQHYLAKEHFLHQCTYQQVPKDQKRSRSV